MHKAKKRRWFLVSMVPMTAGDTGEMESEAKGQLQTTQYTCYLPPGLGTRWDAIRHSIDPGQNGDGGTVAEFLAWALSLVFVQIVLHQLWS